MNLDDDMHAPAPGDRSVCRGGARLLPGLLLAGSISLGLWLLILVALRRLGA